MTELETALILLFAIGIGGFFGFFIYTKEKIADLKAKVEKSESISTLQLKLTAYERLVLFCERGKIENLINRLYQSGWSAIDMQQAMVASIKEEYDYNVSQQGYVRNEIWEAIMRLKDQNVYLINQIASILPKEATALDLNKNLLQLVMGNEKSTLNSTVLEAIRHEVNQLVA